MFLLYTLWHISWCFRIRSLEVFHKWGVWTVVLQGKRRVPAYSLYISFSPRLKQKLQDISQISNFFIFYLFAWNIYTAEHIQIYVQATPLLQLFFLDPIKCSLLVGAMLITYCTALSAATSLCVKWNKDISYRFYQKYPESWFFKTEIKFKEFYLSTYAMQTSYICLLW